MRTALSTQGLKVITIDNEQYALVPMNVGRDSQGQPIFGGYLLQPVEQEGSV